MANVSDALTQRMNFLVQRQGILSSNIANANTPHYITKDLVAKTGEAPKDSFAMSMTNAMHMKTDNGGQLNGTLKEDTRFMQHNGNSVRLDDEMVKMNETQLDYRMMTELYAKQVSLQKLALGQR